MISFVWPPGAAMLAGTGGSETYTAGQIRELLRRGIKAQVVTIGHGLKDGRQDFTDIPFVALAAASELSKLPGTVVFVNRAYPVPTRNKSAIIVHCVVNSAAQRQQWQQEVVGKTVIATSVYSAQKWALYLNVASSRIKVVLPFADPVYANTVRAKSAKNVRILYAGRLHPEKGIYTLLEMMHSRRLQAKPFTVSIILAGLHVPIGRVIARMLQGYPYAKLLPAYKSVTSMAQRCGQTDILVMPSVTEESFGMLLIEAQHAGCRVVASNLGGLPETNCGLLTLVEPRDPLALLQGIEQAVALGPVTKKQRDTASERFSITDSVDELLKALAL
ncbi:MAG: glycosyltransferase family 4 protein [Candidatus Saccharimonas sp.]